MTFRPVEVELVTFAAIAEWQSQPRYRIGILGGVGEFGRNCTVIEDASGKMLVIDAGMMFPGPDLPGVNRVIPDFTNFAGREDDVLALLITHGHEDHIGAIPQFLDHVGHCDILATPLASGIFDRKLHRGQRERANVVEVHAGEAMEIGPFKLTFIAANHSIPQTMGALVEVQGDLLYFTGDFRLDDSPMLGHVTDHRGVNEQAGDRPVRFMFIDSTNAGQSGQTRRESSVRTSIRPAFARARGRIYFTTFASHIERQFLAISLAEEFGRKVHVAGFAMRRNSRLAQQLGLHQFPEDLFVDRAVAQLMKPSELLVLASGSQGETGSFLDRLAHGTQPDFKLTADDLMILSSVPIPGNEPRITRNIDRYMRTGASVLHYRDAHVHVSGHARNDEIGALIHVVRPECVIPVHGDHYNLVRCADLVREVGPMEALVLGTGDVVEVFANDHTVSRAALSSREIYVDDHSDDIPETVIHERRVIAEQGLICVQLTALEEGRSHQLASIQFIGFSGPPLDAVVGEALDSANNQAGEVNVVRLVRNAIYGSIGGPRGRQARVLVVVGFQGPIGG